MFEKTLSPNGAADEAHVDRSSPALAGLTEHIAAEPIELKQAHIRSRLHQAHLAIRKNNTPLAQEDILSIGIAIGRMETGHQAQSIGQLNAILGRIGC